LKRRVLLDPFFKKMNHIVQKEWCNKSPLV